MAKSKPGANAPSRVATPEEIEKFDPVDKSRGFAEIHFPCGKCGGSGIFTHYHGQCYSCHGTGKVWGRIYTPKKRQMLDEAAERRERRKAEKAKEDAIQGYLTCIKQYPEVYQTMAEVMDDVAGHGREHAIEKWGDFIVDVSSKCYNGPISSRQADSLARAVAGRLKYLAKKAEDAENSSPCPDGVKTRVAGEVLTVKWKSSMYGEVLKMLVRDDQGFKVWGTVPKAVRDGLEKGDRVEFVASLERSGDDEAFGFFSRPTQAKVLEKVPTRDV